MQIGHVADLGISAATEVIARRKLPMQAPDYGKVLLDGLGISVAMKPRLFVGWEDNMKSTRLLLSVAALSAAELIFSGGARAEDGPVGQLGFFGVGKAYEIEKGHFYWVGEFSGTFFSDKGEKGLFDHAGVKCPAWDDSDLNNKKDKAGGFCIFTDLNGDQAYMTWQDAGSTEVGAHNPGTYLWTGGTGKYKEIKGDGVYFAVTSVNWPDGTASGYSVLNR